jgi:hypothetical protein
MRTIIFFSLSFIIGFLSSCGESEYYSKERKEIDKLKGQLSGEMKSLEGIDSVALVEMKPFYDRTKKLTQTYYILNDSMEVDSLFAHYMSHIKALKHGPKQAANIRIAKKRLNDELSQLNILQEDLKKNAIQEADSVKKYMDFERNNVSVLLEETKAFVEYTSNLILTYDSIRPYISNFTDSLKRANE